LPEEVFSKRVACGGSVTIWAAISSRGKREIRFREGHQDSRAYITTLETTLLPFSDEVRAKIGDREPIFQQDGAGIHTARIVKAWLNERNISTIEWPAKSPDLSPIENVWDELAMFVYENGRQFLSRDDLKRQILKSWSELDDEKLCSLMKTMEKRLVEVVDRKGSHIDM
jgi:hypothetical protein